MSKKKRFPAELEKDPLPNCTWCGDEIPEDVEIFTIGAKAKPGIDLSEAEGTISQLSLIQANRTVSALVPTRDSPAARDGHDLIFMVCSQSCAQALSDALENDWKLADNGS